MSKFEIKPGNVIKKSTSIKDALFDINKIDTEFTSMLSEYGLDESAYTTFSIREKTNLFATLSELPTDLDLYIGKIDPSTGKPFWTGDRRGPKAYNSSTNPGKEAESIFSVLEKGDYWLGIVANTPVKTNDAEVMNTNIHWSLDGKTFDDTRKLSDDPLLEDQWHLFNSGITANDLWYDSTLAKQNVDIGAPEAWMLDTNANIPIAIIDQGVDIKHPDLVNNLWTNEFEIADNGIDDDNNGYVDDIHGWNFVGNTKKLETGSGHGTNVAGIVGAKGNNGIGVSGVAWNTQLMSLDVFGGTGSAPWWAQVDAIKYAVDHGAKVINMSIGSSSKMSPEDWLEEHEDTDMRKVLQYAYDNDVFIAIAAANEGDQVSSRNRYNGIGDLDEYTTTPAVYSQRFGNIVTVASLNSQGEMAGYSNHGQAASIIAPGGEGGTVATGKNENGDTTYVDAKTSILSTMPVGEGNVDNDGTQYPKEDEGYDYGYMQGTSQASPVIAGMAGLIRSQNTKITALDTVAILRAGAIKNANLKEVVNQGYQADLYQSLDIAQKWQGPDTLTGIGQEVAPVINLSYLTTAQKLNGTLELERDASLDSIIGFYQVLDVNGTIMDANGNTLKPGDDNYKSTALNPGNLIEDMNSFEIENGSSLYHDYSLKGKTNGSYLAPFATTGDNTWFAWKDANSDGLDHFKVLGANQFGLDDQAGPDADKDFTDVVMSFASSEII